MDFNSTSIWIHYIHLQLILSTDNKAVAASCLFLSFMEVSALLSIGGGGRCGGDFVQDRGKTCVLPSSLTIIKKI